MGTRFPPRCAVRDLRVSNPLGWDGDCLIRKQGEPVEQVSNPLGWDGDPCPTIQRWRCIAVSNPLGWDGDPDKADLYIRETVSF